MTEEEQAIEAIWQRIEGTKTPVFVREGWWCECHRSCNARAGQLERGVSVHSCELAAGRHVLPAGHSWIGLRAVRQRKRVKRGDVTWPLYLVTGTLVTEQNDEDRPLFGADGEPLLAAVTPLLELAWDPKNDPKVRPDVFTVYGVATGVAPLSCADHPPCVPGMYL